MSISFKDHFSGHADLYFQSRPRYPKMLFEFLSKNTKGHDLAWDCGTGNGQAASDLADYFKQVIATDASEQQLSNAIAKQNITYRLASAENSGIADHSVDLVTAAAAVHWFDLPKFYDEVNRVLKPDGTIALWSYIDATTGTEADTILYEFGHETMKEYWPRERANVWNKYVDLLFPFKDIPAPAFHCTEIWNLEQLMNYLLSWSASQKYISVHKKNPLDLITKKLKSVWGDPKKVREVKWELGLRVGKIN